MTRGRHLGADRARFGQARQGQGRQRAAALRAARARGADRVGADARRARSISTSPGSSRPKPSSASPTWRATTSSRAPAPRSRPPRCSACSRRRTTSAASARATSRRRRKRSSRPPCSASSARRQVAAQIDAWARRAGRRRLPAAGARAALPDPLQARQERARIQGGGRGGAAQPAGAARPAEGRRRDRLAVPVPLAPLPVRAASRRAPAFPRWRCRPSKEALPLRRRRGVLDRRFGDHRDRRRALGAGPRQRHASRSASTSPRRRLAFAPDSPVDKVARERLSTVYMPGHKLTMLPDAVVEAYTLDRGPRVPGRLALRDASTRPRSRSPRARRGSSASASPPTCATTSSTT